MISDLGDYSRGAASSSGKHPDGPLAWRGGRDWLRLGTASTPLQHHAKATVNASGMDLHLAREKGKEITPRADWIRFGETGGRRPDPGKRGAAAESELAASWCRADPLQPCIEGARRAFGFVSGEGALP